jgi:hypothetical protein
LAEQLESRLARGEEIDIQEHSLLVSTLVRVAQRIGIDRRAPNRLSSSLWAEWPEPRSPEEPYIFHHSRIDRSSIP